MELNMMFLQNNDINMFFGYIYINSIGWKKIPYYNVNEYAIFEDDIILGRVDEIEKLTQYIGDREPSRIEIPRGFVLDMAQKWPNKSIPYTISSDIPKQEIINYAIEYVNLHTEIRLFQRKNEANYINIIPGAINSSYVGMKGGAQKLELQKDGKFSLGTVIHELGHAIGLFHEHQRTDRDHYINVYYENIDKKWHYAFDKIVEIGKEIGRYDYFSIMHYGPYAFSKNKRKTIECKQYSEDWWTNINYLILNNKFGESNFFSKGDFDAIKYLYK